MFNVKMNQFYKAFSYPKKEKLETVHIKGSLDSVLAAGGSKNLRGTFIFSKKATKIEKIFSVFLTLCSKCQINSEDFINFCGLLKKHELYDQRSLESLSREDHKVHESNFHLIRFEKVSHQYWLSELRLPLKGAAS